jgi:hypothetical protein
MGYSISTSAKRLNASRQVLTAALHAQTPARWGTGAVTAWIKFIELLTPLYSRRAYPDFVLIEHRIRPHVRWHRCQHLLFTVDQAAHVEAGHLESMPVRDGVGGAGLHAISAEDTPIVVDVVDLSVALGATHTALRRILSRLDVNAIRWAIRRAQEAGHAFFQSILVPLQHVGAAKTRLELSALQRPRSVRIVLHDRRLEHLHEGDAHTFGDGRYVLQHRHTY